jgi:hypothetical protein
MIIPKKEGCCDKNEQKSNVPCCENLMAMYPPRKRSRSRRRRRRRLSPKMKCKPMCPPHKIIRLPVPIKEYKYLEPIRVPDMHLPSLPPPPPRRPRSMSDAAGHGGSPSPRRVCPPSPRRGCSPGPRCGCSPGPHRGCSPGPRHGCSPRMRCGC